MNTIIIKTDHEFVHRYAKAPADVDFLRSWHRHRLYITVEMEVFHEERELEFIMVRRALDNAITDGTIDLNYVEKSCETVCKEICAFLCESYGSRRMIVTAMEDNENGGKYYHLCSM